VIAGGESATMRPIRETATLCIRAGQGVARFDKRTEQGQDISPVPLDSSGHGVPTCRTASNGPSDTGLTA